MMSTLITTKVLLLLLLLPQTLKFQITNEVTMTEEELEEYEENIAMLLRKRQPKLPTKAAFERTVLVDGVRPLSDSRYCNDETKFKNVHNKLHCVQEHFFLKESIENVQNLCHNIFVACKNGVKRCHRSKKLVDGVYCKLIRGTNMPDCEFESFFTRGYALITCRWENEIRQIIPERVNHIMEIRG